jgi:Ca2+-binding RTX toxin-like protein
MRTALTLVLMVTGMTSITASASEVTAPVRCHGRVATIVGSADSDRLHGTPGRDVIAALGGDDVVRGSGGSDLVCLGRGDDEFDGVRWAHSVFVNAGYGDDTVRPAAERTLVLGMRGDDTVQGGSGRDTVRGSAGRDVISGRAGHDLLIGGSRGDRISGGLGNDILRGGSGNDSLSSDPGADRMVGGTGFNAADFERADRGVVVDLGSRTATGDGHDVVVSIREVLGSPFDDQVVGTGADNWFVGQGGADVFLGGPGDDRVLDLDGGDSLDTGRGPRHRPPLPRGRWGGLRRPWKRLLPARSVTRGCIRRRLWNGLRHRRPV